MLNRWIGITCLVFMLGANALLFQRDILPAWLSGDPPAVSDESDDLAARREAQLGIFDDDGRVVGRNWTITEAQGHFLEINSSTALYPVLLPNGLATPEVRVDTRLRYRREDGVLSDLVMTLCGLPASVRLRGAFVPPDEFACKWSLGQRPGGSFVLDAKATRAIGDVFRPFRRMPGLYVGRTWRLSVLDPLAHILPGLKDHGMLAEPVMVRVTREETIQHRGKAVKTFVVETQRTKAWVAPDGRVLRQEVDLPILGRLTLRDEAFDEAAYQAAKQYPRKIEIREDDE